MSTKPKTILDAKTIPQVALDFMNQTHSEEVELVNNLGKSLDSYTHQTTLSQQKTDAITQQLMNWLAHTEAHFARENQLMQDTGFPAYNIHASEHSRVLNEMKDIIQRWQEQQDINALEDFLFCSWPNWFDAHVNSMDMVTAQFATMNGYDATNQEQTL